MNGNFNWSGPTQQASQESLPCEGFLLTGPGAPSVALSPSSELRPTRSCVSRAVTPLQAWFCLGPQSPARPNPPPTAVSCRRANHVFCGDLASEQLAWCPPHSPRLKCGL